MREWFCVGCVGGFGEGDEENCCGGGECSSVKVLGGVMGVGMMLSGGVGEKGDGDGERGVGMWRKGGGCGEDV